ncbi:hypothetical protein [Nocardia sp. NPDC003345]
MSESQRPVRGFTSGDVREWASIEDGIRLGAVVEADYGRMSAAFVEMDVGARAALPAPYEEVWILTAGVMVLEGTEGPVSAHAGQLIHLREATPGAFRVAEDLRMIALAHPPAWRVDRAAWETVRARSIGKPPASVVTDRALAARQPLEPSAHEGRDESDEGARFGRIGADTATTFELSRDTVVVATRGRFQIHVDRGAGAPAAAGTDGITMAEEDFVYLPAGSAGTLRTSPESAAVWAYFPP